MNCNCEISKLVNSNSNKLWKIFNDMNYEDIKTLKKIDTSCYCGECGGEDIREVIQVIKTDSVELQGYFCLKTYDWVDRKNKPGLEIIRKPERYNKIEKKWEERDKIMTEILFRIQFYKEKIKISHYRSCNPYGWADCNTYPKSSLKKGAEYLSLLLK